MDTQTYASAALIIPAVVLALIARHLRRTSFGLGLRDGAVREFGRGALYGVVFVVVLGLIAVATPFSDVQVAHAPVVTVVGSSVGIWVYFLVLFTVEEIVFRALLMSGLGALTGRSVALVVTAVLVAAPYAFTAHTGVLPLVGAVVTNLLHGWARWRSGRIWWGLAERWVWNSGVLTLGFTDSAFSLGHPALVEHLHGPGWLTGGGFGLEGGIVGIVFLLAMIAGVQRFAHGRRGPWEIRR